MLRAIMLVIGGVGSRGPGLCRGDCYVTAQPGLRSHPSRLLSPPTRVAECLLSFPQTTQSAPHWPVPAEVSSLPDVPSFPFSLYPTLRPDDSSKHRMGPTRHPHCSLPVPRDAGKTSCPPPEPLWPPVPPPATPLLPATLVPSTRRVLAFNMLSHSTPSSVGSSPSLRPQGTFPHPQGLAEVSARPPHEGRELLATAYIRHVSAT